MSGSWNAAKPLGLPIVETQQTPKRAWGPIFVMSCFTYVEEDIYI